MSWTSDNTACPPTANRLFPVPLGTEDGMDAQASRSKVYTNNDK